jgi:hypothetical protein
LLNAPNGSRMEKRWNRKTEFAAGPARLGLSLLLGVIVAASQAATPDPGQPERGYTYIHDVLPSVPWSIHVVRIERGRANLELHTALGGGTSFGLASVSQQMKRWPADAGQPLAAINGDYFYSAARYPGDPIGLQICRGELVSAPEFSRAGFWIDAAGRPHVTNILPQLAVTWPDGKTAPFGLNEDRGPDGLVLFTAAVGASTGTRGGREYVLQRTNLGPWLPLAAGQTYTAQVREVRTTGNTPLTRETLVLSVGPTLTPVPRLDPGAVLKLSTATTPDLAGTQTALGGGPSLVRGGKARPFPGIQLRHPRTAVGWSADHLFLVEVDGRQSGSLGMTMPELAGYMAKLGCEEALNLDGGGSATMWLLGKVVNKPSNGIERSAANALVLIQKPKPR